MWENFDLSGGNSGHVLKINIAVNIALIIIHVSSWIFLDNSWNHSNSTDKSISFSLHTYISPQNTE